VALNINSGSAKLVLLCPAWKNCRTARPVRPTSRPSAALSRTPIGVQVDDGGRQPGVFASLDSRLISVTPTGVGVFQPPRCDHTTSREPGPTCPPAGSSSTTNRSPGPGTTSTHNPPLRAAHDIHPQPAPKGLKKLAGGRAKRHPRSHAPHRPVHPERGARTRDRSNRWGPMITRHSRAPGRRWGFPDRGQPWSDRARVITLRLPADPLSPIPRLHRKSPVAAPPWQGRRMHCCKTGETPTRQVSNRI
jgi:hypothetical protein